LPLVSVTDLVSRHEIDASERSEPTPAGLASWKNCAKFVRCQRRASWTPSPTSAEPSRVTDVVASAQRATRL